MAEQFHFDPDTYLPMVRAEVRGYDVMQWLADAGLAAELVWERRPGRS